MEKTRHPDFPLEAERVRATAARAEKQYQETRALEERQDAELQILRIQTGGVGNDMDVAEANLANTRRVRRNLEHAREKPYFSRIDFDDGENHTYYIGKWGLSDPVTLKPYVIDWRSPVADLYYTGQVGPAGYDAPGGRVEGEITLKRILTVEHGELTDLIEASIVTQDAYLNEVLSDHANTRLRDVVTTIQAEQNVILRADRRRPVIVQGVAGAGKTTVALHRITWLLYTFQDTMKPANLMVLAPNPLFLNYISAVLPDLGVEDVLQTTYYGLTEKLIGRRLPALQDGDALNRLLSSATPEAEKARIQRVLGFKSSLAFKGALEAYIAWLQAAALPEGEVRMGPVRLYSREKLETVFCRELSPFPLAPRKAEFRKHLSERVREGLARWIAAYAQETEKRANRIREEFPQDSPRRQALMQRLYSQRDEKVAEAQATAKNFAKETLARFPGMDLMERYREFLSETPVFPLPEGIDPEVWRECAAYSREILDGRRLDMTDLAPLILLNRAIFGDALRLDIHHSVVDEAQDLSPFQWAVLREVCRNASFTIVGDLNQGIHSYRAVSDWERLTASVFPDVAWDRYELVTSYRSTVEIMDFAQPVALRYPFPGQKPAKPVLRHGPMPILARVKDPLAETAGQIRRLLQAGFKSVAVIAKDPKVLPGWKKKLEKALPDVPLSLLKEEDTEYSAGVMLIPATLTKGLEFDAVILPDVSREAWPDDVLHARLLYVCLTRPLHHLGCFYTDGRSALLEGIPLQFPEKQV